MYLRIRNGEDFLIESDVDQIRIEVNDFGHIEIKKLLMCNMCKKV